MKLSKEEIQYVVLAAIMAVGLFAGTHFMIVQPGLIDKDKLVKKDAEFSKKVKDSQNIAKNMKAYEEKIQDIESKLEYYHKNILTSSEFEFFKESLRDMAKEFNITVIKELTKDVEESNKSVFKESLEFAEKDTLLQLECGYHDFGQFLNRIENYSPFRKLKSLNITVSSGKNNKLRIKLNIITLLSENSF